MHARQTAMLLFVRSRNHAVLDCDALRNAPQRRQLDLVDAIPPRVPLRHTWFVQTISQLQLVNLAARETAHLRKRDLNLAQLSAGNTRARYERSTRSSSY